MADITHILQSQVSTALENHQALRIEGGNSKAFYGHEVKGETLSLQQHTGVIDYDPAELVITARSGTALSEIEKTLSDNNQMLAFEPPHFGSSATLGGTIACGLSGNRRPYTGAARDFMLGCKIINGNAEVLSFGGQVMKNVAGYDVSRLMTGSNGTLGVILEVSLKVLPKPAKEITLVQQIKVEKALLQMNQLAGQPVPLSAATYYDGHLYLRLSGATEAVNQALNSVKGEVLEHSRSFWNSINEHTHRFFKSDKTLWRISTKASSPVNANDKDILIDWGGAQRWLYSDNDASSLRQLVEQQGGHATCFRNASDDVEIFHPVSGKLKELHLNLKSAFDPRGIFNYERMYPGI